MKSLKQFNFNQILFETSDELLVLYSFVTFQFINILKINNERGE